MKDKKYYLSYIDLVVNTMIDVLKFENRRVIDYEDISSYRNNSLNMFQQRGLNVIFLSEGNKKLSKIRKYVGG